MPSVERRNLFRIKGFLSFSLISTDFQQLAAKEGSAALGSKFDLTEDLALHGREGPLFYFVELKGKKMSFIQSFRRGETRLSVMSSLAESAVRKTEPDTLQDRAPSLWPVVGRHLALFFLVLGVACANVCTPVNVPVNGPFPAVVNGIDAVDWSVARIQWTSDATSAVPATNQQIVYATAAEWSAHPNTYPHVEYIVTANVSSSSFFQGGILSNLQPQTTYHVMGQSYQGSAWCTGTDETFTTLAKPTVAPRPALPQKPTLTQPTMTGTHWVYGSNCGTGSGTSVAAITGNVQDCFTKAQPGDDIGFPPGTYRLSNISLPSSPNAVSITCGASTSICTQTGSAPANGTQVVLSSAPYPINPGIPYYVVNSAGNGFQLSSTSGGPAITLTNAGNGPMYIPYAAELAQLPITVHSTAAANLLPPPGVRMGGWDAASTDSAVAQYLPNMPNFQSTDPILYGGASIGFSPFAVGYWFQNIAFSTDPSVYSATNPLDPIGFRTPFSTGTSQYGITFNQCAFLWDRPPSRSAFIVFDGTNMSMINSIMYGLDWWQPYNGQQANISFTSSSITIPSFTFYWVGAGGTSGVGQKQSCAYNGGSVNITGGSSSTTGYAWMNPDCTVTAQFPTGTVATGTNITVTTSATPAYPTYNYTSPVGYNATGYTVLAIAPIQMSGGAVTGFSNCCEGQTAVNPSHNVLQSGGGIQINGWGPTYFDNDYFQGSEIGGPFITDGFASGSPCYPNGLCPQQAQFGNFTITRTTIQAHPCFLYTSACWNGGDYFWRNITENKAGRWTQFDGNIFGPWGQEVGLGQCSLHEAFPDSVAPGYTSYIDSSDFTFTNNTCVSMGAAPGLTTTNSWSQGAPSYPYRNVLFQNNLFLNNNAYLTNGPQPWGSGRTNANELPYMGNACPGGYANLLSGQGQNFVFDHNTTFGQGGCQPYFFNLLSDLSAGISFTNNVINYVGNSDFYSLAPAGSYYTPYNGADPCNGMSGSNLFNGSGACPGMVAFTFKGNIMLATWKNSNPASLTEWSTSDIATAAANYPTSYWPNAATMAGRINSVGWFNTATGNLRLTTSSPYVSGAKAASDGLDVGANIDQLEQHQGKVSNVRVLSTSSNSATLGFYAPDSFACGVDWGSSAFFNGSGSWTRVGGATGNPDPRVQAVTLTGLPSHGLIYYRLNCAVMQPTGSIQLP